MVLMQEVHLPLVAPEPADIRTAFANRWLCEPSQRCLWQVRRRRVSDVVSVTAVRFPLSLLPASDTQATTTV
jgi:hypothetical protein